VAGRITRKENEMNKVVVLVVLAVLFVASVSVRGDGKAMPPYHASTTNGTFAVYTNLEPESVYLDALDLKTSSAGKTWTVDVYNNKNITNTLVNATAASQVEWRTNMVNAVRIVPSGTLTVTTAGPNCWMSAYFSLKQ